LAASAGTNGVNIRRVLDDLRPFEAGEIQVKTTLLTNLPALGPDLGTTVALASTVTNLPPLSQSTGWEPSIRLAQTTMRLALLGLALLIVAALYWRAAVAPLRLALARTNAALDTQNRMEHFGMLAGELAHEIGNALAAVAARLFKLRKSLPEGTPERDSLARIEQEVDRLDRLAKDARKLARRAEPRLTPLEADGLLREIRDFLAPQLEPRQIQLRLGDLAGLRVRADANQMKQVLVNLVHNAAEALGERGNITLRSRRGQVNIDGQDTDCVIFEVRDDGPGIPLDVQERLFEPFFSTKEQGTGLGLPIAKRIVKGHGGTLTFETQPTKGTTFLVNLPVLQETQHHA
jgi:signal transduction histidine kinase